MQDAFWGILIPFLGTSLGAGCVFFLKKSLSDGIQRALTGFAAGVMVAASVWSLLIPAILNIDLENFRLFFYLFLNFSLGHSRFRGPCHTALNLFTIAVVSIITPNAIGISSFNYCCHCNCRPFALQRRANLLY